MAESSPFGYLVVDNRTDAITYSNHRFCEIWGIEKLDERIRHGELKNNDIIPDCLPMLEDIPAFAESCKPLQDEKNRITIEDRIPFVGNRTIRRFSTQVRNDNDEYLGRFYIFEDITRQKRLEEEILRANAALEVSNRALNRLTITDSLTGIFNRRHFDTMLEFEWKRAQRKSECISLIMIDIDYFKNYNDHYGHQAGDECLRQVAGAIREGAGRTADIPARYGGEEFAVILPETDLHGAMIVAETIRLRVLSLQIPHALSTTGQSVSISIGIGCRNPQQNEDGSVLVADADHALYMAKKSGRNCVQSDLRLSA